MTRATRLLFCTTGILLRRLGGDLHLPDVSHIIVDEVDSQPRSQLLMINLCLLKHSLLHCACQTLCLESPREKKRVQSL